MSEPDQIVRCLCCLNENDDGSGVELRGTPGYGSKFDSTLLSEESLAVFVCDRCLEERRDRVRIVHVERPSPRRTVRPWSPDYDASAPMAELSPEVPPCRVAGDGQHDPGIVPGHGVACTKCGDPLTDDHPMPRSNVHAARAT